VDYDKTEIATSYDAGRGHPPGVLEKWLSVVARYAPEHVTNVLDLGCGTGRYAGALAKHFGAHVFAMDPSEKMLSDAALRFRALLPPHDRDHPAFTHDRANDQRRIR